MGFQYYISYCSSTVTDTSDNLATCQLTPVNTLQSERLLLPVTGHWLFGTIYVDKILTLHEEASQNHEHTIICLLDEAALY